MIICSFLSRVYQRQWLIGYGEKWRTGLGALLRLEERKQQHFPLWQGCGGRGSGNQSARELKCVEVGLSSQSGSRHRSRATPYIQSALKPAHDSCLSYNFGIDKFS
ncbi:hypothetical protein QAD02_000238 [Eretmocerus hayati]|uniref:Uncharacterized protein n=1 Tax=Eretmocerus hayati TaxID=131215 RepID=A0ACC2NCS7_9HYME|nr:hypothetical protein QAD02_000238 [Eretmocerus hayati]